MVSEMKVQVGNRVVFRRLGSGTRGFTHFSELKWKADEV